MIIPTFLLEENLYSNELRTAVMRVQTLAYFSTAKYHVRSLTSNQFSNAILYFYDCIIFFLVTKLWSSE